MAAAIDVSRPAPDAGMALAAGLRSVRLIRFLGVGAVGLASDTAVFTLASRAGADDPSARATSLAIATLVTWLLNRHFTFGPSGRPPAVEALRYAGVALVAQGFNWALFLAIRSALPGLSPYCAIAASAGAAAVFSYLGQRGVTFAPRGPVRSGR